MDVKSLKDSNDIIIKLINDNKPFSIVRLGIGDETHMTLQYMLTKNIEPYLKSNNLNGIYSKDMDIKKFELFCKYYNNAIKESDVLASFTFNSRNIINIQNYFSNNYNLQQIHSRSLEPFYAIMENQEPWSLHLKGKKVLVINPFVDSFKKQIDSKFRIFKNKPLFNESQEFIFYKSFNTLVGNNIHNDWFETFKIMCNDIKNIDFDIALLGCGAYGLPICDFIKNELNKSAIYIGGGIQLLFGVMGKRWEENPMWKQIISENECKFIKPCGNEIIPNKNEWENGCYW